MLSARPCPRNLIPRGRGAGALHPQDPGDKGRRIFRYGGRAAEVIGRFLFVACLGLLWVAPDATGETWQKIVAPQFTLYSPAKCADALHMAGEFQQFIGALGEIVRVDARKLPPLTIVVFDREKEFRRFRPMRPNGKRWNVAGFFSRQEGWSVFGLAGARLDDEVRRTVFHEGVHWFLSGNDLPNPPWLEEGLAEVFSTFIVENNRREWGQPISEHVEVLRSTKLLSLERLLSVSRTDPLFNETRRTGLFYAESWAFVHYLLFAEHNQERLLFNDYVKAFHSGVHPDESFRSVFKKDYSGMDRELSAYLGGGRYFVSARAVGPVSVSLQVEPATALEREVALARLALGALNLELAQEHATVAQLVGPTSAEASEVAGYVAAARGDTARMLESFAEAARRGSEDYRVYFEPAQRKHQQSSGLGATLELSSAEARQIARGYEQTIILRPWFLPAYQGLGGIIELLGAENKEARSFLQTGRGLYPEDGMILLGLAAAAHQIGTDDEAHNFLAKVLTAAEKHPSNVKAYAWRLESEWAFADASRRIRTLAEAQRYEEALAEISALQASGNVPLTNRPSMAINRANLQTTVYLVQAQSAWNEQRWSDARKLLEAVVDLPIETAAKAEARRRLADLDWRNLGKE